MPPKRSPSVVGIWIFFKTKWPLRATTFDRKRNYTAATGKALVFHNHAVRVIDYPDVDTVVVF